MILRVRVLFTRTRPRHKNQIKIHFLLLNNLFLYEALLSDILVTQDILYIQLCLKTIRTLEYMVTWR